MKNCQTSFIVRKQLGKSESPSIGIIDSRSVKTSHHVDSDRGIDGNKKIKGRKHHVIFDALGLPMAIVIHAANIHDGKGAPQVVDNFAFNFHVWSKSSLTEDTEKLWLIG